MAADFKQGTNLVGKVLAGGQLASGETTIYTVPVVPASATKISSAVLCNTSAAAVTVSVAVVPSGGTVDGTHRVVSGYSLAAGDSTTLPELVGAFLDAGAFVSINASAGAAVDYLLTGVVSS